MGRGARARAAAATVARDPEAAGGTTKGGTDASRVRSAFHRELREGEPTQGERLATKESIFQTHLYPALGSRKLDAIGEEHVQQLKATLADYSRKTVNNVLSVLNKTLKVAVRWRVIATMPCTIELVKVSNVVARFYEFDEYQRLVEAAARIDTRTHVLVLLGGDAGLRRGEMIALRWSDVDFSDAASSRCSRRSGKASWTRRRAARGASSR